LSRSFQQDCSTAPPHFGIVLYVRTAFGPDSGAVLVPVEPVVTFPFALVWRGDARSAALDAVLAAV
jgi:hypothetical protein